MTTYEFRKITTKPSEAIEALMETSWALQYSTLEYFKNCDTPTDFKKAVQAADEAGSWAKYKFVPLEEGGFRFEFATYSGANRVTLRVGATGMTEATYVAESSSAPTESSIVASAIRNGWILPPDLKSEIDFENLWAKKDALEEEFGSAVSVSCRQPIRKVVT